MTQIVPVNNRLLIKELYADQVSKGGIIIPDSAVEKPMIGVVAFASGKYISDEGDERPSQVAVGDTVMFGKHAGSVIKHDGETYRVLLEKDIFLKIVD